MSFINSTFLRTHLNLNLSSNEINNLSKKNTLTNKDIFRLNKTLDTSNNKIKNKTAMEMLSKHNKTIEFPDMKRTMEEKYNDERNHNFINSWDTSNFTLTSSISDEMGVRGHNSKKEFQFIVHTASIEQLINKDGIFSHNGESELNNWDVLCASIVNEKKTFTYGSIGVILDVPKQNMLAASPDDLMSETNIGATHRVDYLVNISNKEDQVEKYKQMPNHERTGLLKKEISRHARHKNTPYEVLKKTYNMRNELLICTRSDVNVHKNEECTKNIKIAGIFLNDCDITPEQKHLAEFTGDKILSKDEKYEIFIQHAKPLAEKLGIPIIYFNGQSDTAEKIID
ncbi:hypothetical protein G7083_07380 [Vibrio sp. HDW18]|uniref:hypothetical protein n=1 Tax=Vibrio sp. HDW18 TaxID=2714948 RepID=UPI00140BC77B|nr:hypothetical protein [Vibrio sp. HDW18]QIL85692.1 hypothetical protein G7083_07380 [Vibrio sp. HDW18]